MKFKDARRTSFAVGDKVRILPSAVDIMVAKDEVGKTGIITHYGTDKDILVYMDEPRKVCNCRIDWCVESSQIELVKVPGQQLLLWDDIWEE